MSATDQGIILRTHPVTETSVIVRWLTRDRGTLSTVAKGARKPKSAFAGKLDLFFRADFSFQPSRRSDLHVLREVHLLDLHTALRADIDRLRTAAYAGSLINRAVEPEVPVPELFALLDELLTGRLGPLERPWTVLRFEARFLQDQGLGPLAGATSLSPGSAKLLEGWLDFGAEAAGRLQPSPGQQAEIAALHESILRAHLGTTPRGRPILRTARSEG